MAVEREGPDFADVNKGPNGGGAYNNDDNVLVSSGMTHPTEATSPTGELMGDMPTQDNRGSIGGSQQQASSGQMSGGNG